MPPEELSAAVARIPAQSAVLAPAVVLLSRLRSAIGYRAKPGMRNRDLGQSLVWAKLGCLDYRLDKKYGLFSKRPVDLQNFRSEIAKDKGIEEEEEGVYIARYRAVRQKILDRAARLKEVRKAKIAGTKKRRAAERAAAKAEKEAAEEAAETAEASDLDFADFSDTEGTDADMAEQPSG
jgi:hypothetical protein